MEALYEQYYETINKCNSHKDDDSSKTASIHPSKPITKTSLDTKVCINGTDYWYHRNIVGKDDKTYYSPVVTEQSSLTAAFEPLSLPKISMTAECVSPSLNSNQLYLLLDAIDDVSMDECIDTLNINNDQLSLLKDALE